MFLIVLIMDMIVEYRWVPKRDRRYMERGVLLSCESPEEIEKGTLSLMMVYDFTDMLIKNGRVKSNVHVCFSGRMKSFGIVRDMQIKSNRMIAELTNSLGKTMSICMRIMPLSEPQTYFLFQESPAIEKDREYICDKNELFGFEIFPEKRRLEVGKGLDRFLYFNEVPPCDFDEVKRSLMDFLELPYENQPRSAYSLDDREAFNFIFDLEMQNTAPVNVKKDNRINLFNI